MKATVTGYQIERTNTFIECNFSVNGNFQNVRNELRKMYDSDIFFRFKDEPESTEERIVNIVSYEYDMRPEEIFQRSRKRFIVEPRQIIQYLLKEYSELTLERMGNLTKRDHSTILNSYQVVTDLCASDPKYKARIEKIKRIFENNIDLVKELQLAI